MLIIQTLARMVFFGIFLMIILNGFMSCNWHMDNKELTKWGLGISALIGLLIFTWW